MKLLFLTDRIWGKSAYSKVLKSLSKRLVTEHDVSHIPMSSALKGVNPQEPFNLDGVSVYGAYNDPMGEDVAYELYNIINADMLITIKEPWNFNYVSNQALNFVPMAIIDHSPVSHHLTARLSTPFRTIAVSRFGQRELKNKKIPSTYIPHGLESYYRHLADEQEACAELWYFDPDAFKIGIVAMNRARKMIPRMFRGIKKFMENNPDVKVEVLFWGSMIGESLQYKPYGVGDTGTSLMQEAVELGLAETIHWSDEKTVKEGIPETQPGLTWDMVTLYNSFDVLLHCTGGEGFGLPLIEAQACGKPVITTDYAAGPENVGAGLTVPYNDYIVINSIGTRYALPDIDAMAEALAKIYNADRERLTRKAVRFTERYLWDNIYEKHMRPFLEDCEKDLYPHVTKKGVTSWYKEYLRAEPQEAS